MITKKISAGMVLATLFLLASCGGGGGSSTAAPAAPAASISYAVKQLNFSWPAVNGATSYKLLENANGASGFSIIQGGITATSTSKAISVASHDWANARYMVEACNSAGCTDSAELNTIGSVLKTVGFVKASNTGANDEFSSHNGGGFSASPTVEFSPAIALSGDGQTLAVGAGREDSPDQGISADQLTADDGSADQSGAVYLYRHGVSGWTQQAYIKASDSAANVLFGHVVALSQDGNTLAVISQFTGSVPNPKVYVFRFSGSVWSEQTILTLPALETPNSLALDDTGNILLVGKPFLDAGTSGSPIVNAGAVAVYRFDSGASSWGTPVDVRSDAPLTSAHLGMSLSISADGNVFVTGANGVTVSGKSNAGAAYVFRYNSGSSAWVQEQLLTSSNPDVDDDFGRAVALSHDGSTIAIGAIKEDGMGTGVSNGGTGDVANSGSDAGAVYVYRFASSAWSQQAYIKASNTDNFDTFGDRFGNSLALSRDGNLLVVGAPFEDSAANGVGGDENDNTENKAGAAYQYQFNTTSGLWDTANITYIKAAYNINSANFAESIALSDDGSTLAASCDGDDNNASGVTTGADAALPNFSALTSGAVYLY